MIARRIEKGKGSYVLLIRLADRVEISLRGHPHTLEPGYYAYCGSAMGPGGLEARIARHRRRDKKVHWHVDQVTTRAPVIRVGVSLALSECDLVGQLLKQPGVCIPVPGFGSSDCKACKGHFVKLGGDKAFHNLGILPFGA